MTRWQCPVCFGERTDLHDKCGLTSPPGVYDDSTLTINKYELTEQKAKPIFTLTVIRYEKSRPPGWDSRTWGWYPTFESAEQAVLSNEGDAFEAGYYKDAVIEEVPAGMMPIIEKSWWYRAEYKKDNNPGAGPTVSKIDPPTQFKHVSGLSMG